MNDQPDTPLPVDPGLNPRSLAIVLLQLAEEAGWLSYDGMDLREGGDRYQVTLPNGVARELLSAEVPAWVLGVADTHGRADLVAYRPGLTDPGNVTP